MTKIIGLCLLLLSFLWSIFSAEMEWETNYEILSQDQLRPYNTLLQKLSVSKVAEVTQAKEFLKVISRKLGSSKINSYESKEVFLKYIKKSLRWQDFFIADDLSRANVQIFDEFFFNGLVYRQILVKSDLIGSFRGLLILPGLSTDLTPAIIGLHGHGGSPESFAEELLGHTLAEKGFVVFLPRFRAMESEYEREIARELFLSGKHLMAIRAFESYLSTQILLKIPSVDPQRIGVIAHSGGSAIAHLLIRLVGDFKACVTDYDSSYHFYWDEFCCEAVPDLALVSHRLNNRSDFSCKALKAPYHFAPREEEILNFFDVNLRPKSGSFGGLQRELEEQTNQFLSKAIGFFLDQLKNERTQTLGSTPLDESIKEKLAHSEFPSIAEPFLMEIINWEVFSTQLEKSYHSAALLKLPINRLSALGLILPLAKRHSTVWHKRILGDIKIELGKIHDPEFFLSLLKKLNLVNTAGTASISLLKEISTSRTIFKTLDYSHQEKINAYATQIHRHGFSEESLKLLEGEPGTIGLQCLLKGADKIFNANDRATLFDLIMKAYLKVSKGLDAYDINEIQLRILRSFPTKAGLIPFKVPPLGMKLPKDGIVFKKSRLAKEALHHGRFDLIKSVLESSKADEKSEILYKLALHSMENRLHRSRALELFSGEITTWEEPSSRVGIREEILREGGPEEVGESFQLWLNLTFEDLKAIEAPFDRQKHAQNMYELAMQHGFSIEAKKFYKLLPWKTDQQKISGQLNDMDQENEKNTGKMFNKETPGASIENFKKLFETQFEESLKIFTNLTLAQKISTFPMIMSKIKSQSLEHQVHSLVDLTHNLLEQGNRFEACRVAQQLSQIILNLDLNHSDDFIIESLIVLTRLGLYEEYRSVLKRYLKTLAQSQDRDKANLRWQEVLDCISENSLMPIELLLKIQFKDAN